MNSIEYIRDKYSLSDTKRLPIVLNKVFRVGLYELFNELEYKVGCEVGVELGRNAWAMLERISGLKLSLVDSYHKYTNVKPSRRNYLRKVRAVAHRRLRHSNVEFFEMLSEDAAKHVQDNSLDFVYIDANHLYDFVMLDIILWSRKVRKGGIISGHDYFVKRGDQILVTHAVKNYTVAHGINPWYITSSKPDARKIRREGNPSWFWVKT